MYVSTMKSGGTGQPLGYLSNEKNAAVRFLFNRSLPQLSDDLRRLTRTCVFVVGIGTPVERLLGEAIRSVSHLFLAPAEPMSRLAHISNRKERTGRLLPGSLRLGFLRGVGS
jgi:hypothetical protein